jgi:hypothetical protein
MFVQGNQACQLPGDDGVQYPIADPFSAGSCRGRRTRDPSLIQPSGSMAQSRPGIRWPSKSPKYAIAGEEFGTGLVLHVHVRDPIRAGDPGPGRGESPPQHTTFQTALCSILSDRLSQRPPGLGAAVGAVPRISHSKARGWPSFLTMSAELFRPQSSAPPCPYPLGPPPPRWPANPTPGRSFLTPPWRLPGGQTGHLKGGGGDENQRYGPRLRNRVTEFHSPL